MKTLNFKTLKEKKNTLQSKMQGQRGILTFDFIFSFMMVIGLFQLFYYLTYTLIAAQATQYVMFSASRNFFAGHHSVSEQTRMAEKKYKELTENTPLAAFYKKNLIELSDFQARPFDEYPVAEEYRQKFIGTSVTFDAKVLDFKVPFLGSTASQLEGNSFTAEISSFLYREPTSQECLEFNRQRAKAIKKLQSKYNNAGTYGFTDNPANIGVFSDNGC